MVEYISEEYCNKNRTKKASRGYKVVCPSCRGKDLWVTESNKSAFCFECGINYIVGEEGTQRARRDSLPGKVFDVDAIRVLYQDTAEYYHACISKEHEQYLLRRGITPEAISFFKIGFCPPGASPRYLTETAKEAGLADRDGHPWLANRIIFPYVGDGRITDLRGRTMTNEEPKYKNLYHRSIRRGAVYPFNYDEALRKAVKSKTIIVTEGEIKAVVADVNDFAVVALPGMLSYRPAFVPQPGIRTVVIYDSNSGQDDRIRVDRAIANLSRHIPQFSVVTLPLLGQTKMDIDLFLLTEGGGPDRLRYYIENAVEYPDYRRLRAF